MTAWLLVVLAGLASYLLRAVPVALLSSRGTPAWFERLGPYVAPVSFAALSAAALAGSAVSDHATAVPRLLALLVAAAVAYRTRSRLWPALVGLGLLWLLTAVLGR